MANIYSKCLEVYVCTHVRAGVGLRLPGCLASCRAGWACTTSNLVGLLQQLLLLLLLLQKLLLLELLLQQRILLLLLLLLLQLPYARSFPFFEVKAEAEREREREGNERGRERENANGRKKSGPNKPTRPNSFEWLSPSKNQCLQRLTKVRKKGDWLIYWRLYTHIYTYVIVISMV